MKQQVPIDIIADKTFVKKAVIKLTNQYLEYCQLDEKRSLLYGNCITDSDAQLRKECLQKIQLGLPDSVQVRGEIFDNKTNRSQNGKCYIATAVYGSYDNPSVCVLRRFRDNNLSTNIIGKKFVKTYYIISPYLIKFFGGNIFFLYISKKILDLLVTKIKMHYRYGEAPYYDK